MTNTPTLHSFTVQVSGCTPEQAEEVMSERIGPDEDLGFDYTIGWEATPAPVPVANLIIDDQQRKTILRALRQGLRDAREDLAGYPVPKTPRSKRLAAIREDLNGKCQELQVLIELIKNSSPAAIPKD